MKTEVIIEMGLCEVSHVMLHPDQLYRFVVMPDCDECKHLAAMEKQSRPSKTLEGDDHSCGGLIDCPKCGEYIERVCGNCAFFTGEECNGAYEGAERYEGSEACASFEPNAEVSR